MVTASRLLVGFFALFNLGFGLYDIVTPEGIAALIEVEILSGVGRVELRAVYGGIFLMLGVGGLWSLWRPDGASWMRLIALIFSGLVLGRLLDLALADFVSWTVYAGAFEAAGAVSHLWAAKLRESRDRSGAI